MRLSEDAPVDTMGCEKAGTSLPPKVIPLSVWWFVDLEKLEQVSQVFIHNGSISGLDKKCALTRTIVGFHGLSKKSTSSR